MLLSRITSKDQAPTRRRLSAHERLAHESDSDRVTVHPLRGTILDHYGSIRPKNRPEDFRAVREFVGEEIARDYTGTILEHRGTVRPKNRPEDFRAIREFVHEEIARDYARKLRQ
ncbi:MAG: hypothetical protein AAF471_03335 [Myxococcota bacterium]